MIRLRHDRMALAFCAAAFAFSPVLAAEPETVVIGGPENQGPPVTVDLGAIDEAVGAPSSSPDQIKLHPPGKGSVHLHRPGPKAAKAAAAKPKEETKPAAEQAAAQPASTETASAAPVESKPAAPVAPSAPPPPVAPSPPAAPAPAAASPPVAAPPPQAQVAALPSAPKPLTPPSQTEAATAQPEKPNPSQNALRVLFVVESDQLQDPAPSDLDAMAAKLKGNDQRVQIIAYASGSADQSSAARRLSLKRALTVREYLIEKGVRSTRMDVRALGNQSGEGPPDRVDVVLETH